MRSELENFAQDLYWEGTCRAHLGLLSLRPGHGPGAGLCSMGQGQSPAGVTIPR